MKFFGSEITPTPPPSEIFRKFIHFGIDRLPLERFSTTRLHSLCFAFTKKKTNVLGAVYLGLESGSFD